uniref:NADH-plastoquinone oxidoreductase subunit K n=1 Tax=Solanum thomasiifolium TaxID=744128 RepID=UPI001FCCFD89|nr:NADH-plastoquinone oxidoreductase subunit K [Solanum thomasiifolium]UNZ86816.1 NADH-plastoquinone oxidoreductase subunit K [Solanum thomasiifolium]
MGNEFRRIGRICIYRSLYEDRIRSQRANRCFTTNHKFHVRRSIHTGNYDQRVLYQPPSTSEIPTEIFFKYKNSVSSAELVN